MVNILKTDLFLLQKNISPAALAKGAREDFEIKFVSPEDCKRIAAENKWQDNFSVDINGIIEESNVCAVAEVNGSLAHWTQITFDTATVGEINKRIRLDAKSAYLHGVYTAKAFRRRGITSNVLEKIAEHLQERGITKIYIFVDAHNDAMLKIVGNAGFTKLGKATLVTFGKLHFYTSDSQIKSFLSVP